LRHWQPIGLGAGRIGNFINSELWGRTTDVPWAMVFPNGGPLARHPSQLLKPFRRYRVICYTLAVFQQAQTVMATTGMALFSTAASDSLLNFQNPDAQFRFYGIRLGDHGTDTVNTDDYCWCTAILLCQ